jgi:acetyl esterase/lipase
VPPSARWFLLVTSAALLFVNVWIVIPAPNRALLRLAVATPELSPVLLVFALVLAAVSGLSAKQNRIARLALVLSAVASAFASVPLVQLPFAIARFNGAMKDMAGNAVAAQRGSVRVTRSVNFSNADGVPLALDVYQPPQSGTYPVLLQIYGGSWQSGSPASDEWFARHFAARGYVVFAVDYRHAPEWKWPEQIVDMRTALYWISEKSSVFGTDTTRIVIVGRSAGAQLAMRLAYQEGPSSIRGVVNFYGPVDLAEGWRRPPEPDPADVRGIVQAFIGGTPRQKPEHYRHASPISYVSRTVAPTLSLYGARDHVVEAHFGRQLDAALTKAGATSVLLELPWSEHSFDAVPNGIGRYVAMHYAERFIAWAVNR